MAGSSSPRAGGARNSVERPIRTSVENDLNNSPKELDASANRLSEDQLPVLPAGEGAASVAPSPLRPPSSGIPLGTTASIVPTTGAGVNEHLAKQVDNVLYSDIGISILLVRLKQSITSAREYASFLKKRATLEDDHAQGIKKLNRAVAENVRKQEGRQGSYAHQLADVTRAQDRMADNGLQLSSSLLGMFEDLNELINTVERGRKTWKQEGLNNEKKVKDAESQMEKAKSRYDSLAEDYDRARAGDRSSGRVFTVKGPKSAEKHEEDLHRKVQAADADYASKVQAAQVSRHENLNFNRPNAIRHLQELIKECDSALALQLQKFAALNERLLVSNGLIVSPIKNEHGMGTASMRDMAQAVDNDSDLNHYIVGHTTQVPPKPADIKYEKHPTLATGPPPSAPNQSLNTTQQRRVSQPPPNLTTSTGSGPTTASHGGPNPSSGTPASAGPQSQASQPFGGSQNDRFAPNSIPQQHAPPQQQYYPPSGSQPPSAPMSEKQPYPPDQNYNRGPPPGPHPATLTGSPNLNTGMSGGPLNQHPISNGQQNRGPSPQYGAKGPSQSGPQGRPNGGPVPRELAPTKPVFGISLENLFRRDETAVPMVVYQCIQAVDLFGLEIEGIYRLSGNQAHINQLKSAFDHDSSRVDFRNPENFYQDVNSVAGLLKQFFRDLPDPLLTMEHYGAFIEAAKIDEDALRRDSLHAVINALPDPNYATLRALILHLHRVQEHSAANRMTSNNLAICFAPTILGQHGPMADAGLQARVIDTILQNTYEIFDED